MYTACPLGCGTLPAFAPHKPAAGCHRVLELGKICTPQHGHVGAHPLCAGPACIPWGGREDAQTPGCCCQTWERFLGWQGRCTGPHPGRVCTPGAWDLDRVCTPRGARWGVHGCAPQGTGSREALDPWDGCMGAQVPNPGVWDLNRVCTPWDARVGAWVPTLGYWIQRGFCTPGNGQVGAWVPSQVCGNQTGFALSGMADGCMGAHPWDMGSGQG